MRGRLINPFDVEIAPLDTAATAEDPTGPGDTIASGYDEDFQEPVVLTGAGGVREPGRREGAIIRLPAQIEVAQYERLIAFQNGDSPDSRVTLVFHFRDLERAGLVDGPTGEALVRRRDRLVAVYRRCSTQLVQRIRNPPGLYAVEAAPELGGLGLHRNLLLVTFEDRERGPRA